MMENDMRNLARIMRRDGVGALHGDYLFLDDDAKGNAISVTEFNRNRSTFGPSLDELHLLVLGDTTGH